MLRYDAATGAFDKVFVPDGSGGLRGGFGFAFGPDGDVYIANYGWPTVGHFDGVTGAYLGTITGGDTTSPRPWRIDVAFGTDANGDGRPEMYVTNEGTNSVLRYAGPLTATGETSLPVTVLDAVTATYSSSPNAAIPDNLSYSSWSINVPDAGPVLDVDVTLNITHPNVGDLDVLLISPAGTTRRLFYRVGGSGDNFTGTIIDDEATISISDGSAPFTGRFKQGPPLAGSAITPGPLSDFDGEQANGTWTLQISDRVKKNSGTLSSWSVTLTRGVGPLPPPSISIDDVSMTEGNAGTKTANFTVSLSNPSSETVTVNYATADGTATTANNDYLPAGDTLTFLPGQTSKTVSITLNGDTASEPNETFFVNLSVPTHATLADAQGIGTILDDDSTKFFVVDDAGTDRTYRYGPPGNAGGNSTLTGGNTAPRGAASNNAGTLVWVVDANKTVYVYNPSGALLGSWTAGGLAGNAQVEGIAVDPNGSDIWLVDNRQDRVFRYTGAATRTSGSQNAASSFTLASGNTNPRDIVTDGTSLWVVNDAAPDKVFKYTLTGTLLGGWTIDAANAAPTGITLDPGNPQHLWIVDSGTDRVYQYDNAVSRTSGSQSSSGSFALAAGNANPQGIADPPAPGLLTRPRHKGRHRGNNSNRGLKRDPADEPRGKDHALGRRDVD